MSGLMKSRKKLFLVTSICVSALLSLSSVSPLSLAAPNTASDPALNPGLEAAVSKLEADGFKGLVLAAHGDQVLLEKVVGEPQTGQPALSKDSVFRYASITKLFTSVMVMQQVDAGKLALDMPLGKFWPDFPNEAARAITLRQFMLHMSGLPNPDKLPQFYFARTPASGDMQLSATSVCAAPLQRAPGEAFDYNNCDFIVLGALLEKVTGIKYQKLLQQKIFNPAKMTHSGMYSPPNYDDVNHVHGIVSGNPEIPINFASYGAAGATFGTLRDLLAFDQAFSRGRLLSSTSRAEMVKPNAVGGALGVWSYPFSAKADKPASMIVERQGWIGGIRTLNLVDIKNEAYLIMISTNGDVDLSQTWANKGPAAGLLQATLLAIP